MTIDERGINTTEKIEDPFLLEVPEVLGSLRSPRYSKINVTVLVVECQMQKYWAHGVEISEDLRRDKFCRRDPDFCRNSGNHHDGSPETEPLARYMFRFVT